MEDKAAPAAEAPAPVKVMTHQPRRSVALSARSATPLSKPAAWAMSCSVASGTSPAELRRSGDPPRYACIPKEYQDKMVYRGEFYMDLAEPAGITMWGLWNTSTMEWCTTSSTTRSSSLPGTPISTW